jgi:hypothetical protein
VKLLTGNFRVQKYTDKHAGEPEGIKLYFVMRKGTNKHAEDTDGTKLYFVEPKCAEHGKSFN